MKTFITLIAIFILSSLRSQITQLNSGTSVNLSQISSIGSNIIISGLDNNYLTKSYDACNQLTNLPCPGPTNYYNYIQRIDTNNFFLLSKGNGFSLFYSSNDGLTWTSRYTSGYFASAVNFFDTLEGIMDNGIGNTLLRTYDGGSTWTSTTSPTYDLKLNKNFGDSTVIIGEYVGGVSQFFVSNDRGHTWPKAGGFTAPAADFCFLSKDTLFGVSGISITGDTYFTKSFDGGATWQNSFSPIAYSRGILFRNKKEGYIVGKDFSNNAVIAKTIDLGVNWSLYHTGISGQLSQISFLNDSTAILIGDNGLLLRWNYKKTVFTGFKNYMKIDLAISIYPNPVKDKFNLELEGVDYSRIKLKMFNSLGEIIYTSVMSGRNHEIDLSPFSSGIYFLIGYNQFQQKSFKIFKE